MLDRDDLLRFGILLFPDSQAQRAMVDVGRHVHAALMLLQGEARGIPALGKQACRVVDRQAGVVAEIGTGTAIQLVLVRPGIPDT